MKTVFLKKYKYFRKGARRATKGLVDYEERLQQSQKKRFH